MFLFSILSSKLFLCIFFSFFFFFNDTATTEIYTLSLHDALQSPAPGASARLDRFGRHRSSGPRDGGQAAPASASGALSLDGVGTTSRPQCGGARPGYPWTP